MDKQLVFIYGSLRRGCARSMAVRFPGSKFIAGAKVHGILYDLGAYPGLLLNESNSMVTGEVYEVDDEIMAELDEFEASSHYRRKQVELSLDGQAALCWTYEPDPEFYALNTLVTSGDWIEYSGAKTDGPEDLSPEETQ
jgi:gamma-glutamylcyclotransferase (GGCT)/AIG2-like uncharacterized protein YtfP